MTHAQTETLLSLLASACRLGWAFLACHVVVEIGWILLHAARRWGRR